MARANGYSGDYDAGAGDTPHLEEMAWMVGEMMEAKPKKIEQGHFKRLRKPSSAASVMRRLQLPEGITLYSDPPKESFLAIDADGLIVAEREWKDVIRWRYPGKTMSFVVRHEPRTRKR